MQFTMLTYFVTMQRLRKKIIWSQKGYFAHGFPESEPFRKTRDKYKEIAFHLHVRQSRERKANPLSAMQYFFIDI